MKILTVLLLVFCGSVHAAVCLHSLPGETRCTVVPAATTAPATTAIYNPTIGNIPLHMWPNRALTSAAGVPAVGYTKAQIHSQFVANMNYNFDPTKTWSRRITIAFAGLSDVELARLTMLYVQEGGNIQHWVNLFVGYGVDVHRLASVVGEQVVLNGLAQYGAAGYAVWSSTPAYKVAIIPRSVLHYQSMGLSPKAGFKAQTNPMQYLDFTAYEIYLDFRTGGVALTVKSALLATAMVEYAAIDQSYKLGVAAGDGMLWVGDQLSPGFSEWLAAELGAGIQDVMSLQFVLIPEYNFLSTGCGCSIVIDWDNLVMKD